MDNIFNKKTTIIKESINFDFQDLSHDVFEGFTFNECYFIGTNLESAQFKNCIFNNCNLFGCDLMFSRIDNCKFFNCNFSKVDASDSIINSCFEECDFKKSNFTDINFNQSAIKKCNFEQILLEQKWKNFHLKLQHFWTQIFLMHQYQEIKVF